MRPSEVPVADRLTRFSDRATAYAAHRPSYPPSAIDAVLEGLKPTGLRVADIGAGTGISSRIFADRGCDVVAVEPNAGMRQAAEEHLRVRWMDATGETTTLPDSSQDLVACAQAFHWLAARSALREFHRILRRNGRVALIWNVLDDAWEVSRRYKQLIVACANEPPTSPWFLPVGEPLRGAEGFQNARLLKFTNVQTHDREGLIGRALSASYSPKSGPKNDQLVAGLKALFDEASTSGVITLKYQTEVHLAEAVK